MLNTLKNFTDFLRSKQNSALMRIILKSKHLEDVLMSKLLVLVDEQTAQFIIGVLNDIKIEKKLDTMTQVLLDDELITMLEDAISLLTSAPSKPLALSDYVSFDSLTPRNMASSNAHCSKGVKHNKNKRLKKVRKCAKQESDHFDHCLTDLEVLENS